MCKFLLLYFNHMFKYFSNIHVVLKVHLMLLLDGIPCCSPDQYNTEVIHLFDEYYGMRSSG